MLGGRDLRLAFLSQLYVTVESISPSLAFIPKPFVKSGKYVKLQIFSSKYSSFVNVSSTHAQLNTQNISEKGKIWCL